MSQDVLVLRQEFLVRPHFLTAPVGVLEVLPPGFDARSTGQEALRHLLMEMTKGDEVVTKVLLDPPHFPLSLTMGVLSPGTGVFDQRKVEDACAPASGPLVRVVKFLRHVLESSGHFLESFPHSVKSLCLLLFAASRAWRVARNSQESLAR